MDEIDETIEKNGYLKVCIKCKSIATKENDNFKEYEIPKTYKNITGTICDRCMDEYKTRKGL